MSGSISPSWPTRQTTQFLSAPFFFLLQDGHAPLLVLRTLPVVGVGGRGVVAAHALEVPRHVAGRAQGPAVVPVPIQVSKILKKKVFRFFF